MKQIKHNPKIVCKNLTGGRTAIYLEYYYGRTATPCLDENGAQIYYDTLDKNGHRIPKYKITHDRRKTRLELYLTTKPRTPEERLTNTETMRKAEAIRAIAEQTFLQERKGYSVATPKADVNFIDYCDKYVDSYQKKDKRVIALSVQRFKDYICKILPNLVISKKRNNNGEGAEDVKVYNLNSARIDKAMVTGFVDYLQEICEGSGAYTSFARFKKICKEAYENGVFMRNPCEGVRCGGRDNAKEKDVLSPDEERRLIATHYEGENPEIRNAFIFSLYTGVRFCDVAEMRYGNIDYSNGILRYGQSKTRAHSSDSRVAMKLHNGLIEIIGRPEDKGKTKDDIIFDLPSHTMCLKALRRWTKRAGIDKHITWHCARHSFATILSSEGTAPRDVAALLGHSDLQQVARYARATEKGKAEAIARLPELP